MSKKRTDVERCANCGSSNTSFESGMKPVTSPDGKSGLVEKRFCSDCNEFYFNVFSVDRQYTEEEKEKQELMS